MPVSSNLDFSAMNLPEPISDAADKAKDLLDGTADKAKGLYGDVADKAKDFYGDASDKVKDLYDEAAAKSKDLLMQVPKPVKEAGAKTADAFNKLSNTQKIVGGVLLAAGLAWLVAPKKKR